MDAVLSRNWAVALLLLVVWSPLLIQQVPGTANPDFVHQLREILSDPATIDYPTYDVYPIAHYLLPEDHGLWSTHHNAFLTLFYGVVMKIGIALTGGTYAGFVALTLLQLAFTLAAFGRAASLMTAHVRSDLARCVFLVLVAATGWPVALWAIALAKNPLFAAALVWLLALCIDHVLSAGSIARRRMVEGALVATVALNSAKFAAPILLVLFVMLLLARRDPRAWVASAVILVLPLAAFQLALKVGVGTGAIIPGDPMAGKGVQVQSLAATLTKSPDAISPEDREALDRIFDVDQMLEVYTPRTMAPIRGAGYREGAYRYTTVTAEEAAAFDGIWWRVAQEEPDLVADAILLKSHAFFDPLATGRDHRPRVTVDDDFAQTPVDGTHALNDDERNAERRQAFDTLGREIGTHPLLRFTLASPLRVAAVVMLAMLAVLLRRPAAWIWALPMALHCGVLIMSPLNASGRYALGITYFLPFAVLAMFLVADRARQSADAPRADAARTDERGTGPTAPRQGRDGGVRAPQRPSRQNLPRP